MSNQRNERIDRGELLDLLNTRFSSTEVRDLCFFLDVDWDNLGGPNTSNVNRLINLIEHLERRQSLDVLVQGIIRLRPDVGPLLGMQPPPIEPVVTESLDVLAEAKLILVGDGNVGKTSLVNRLVYNTFNPSESTTRGVAITRWNIDLPRTDVRTARLNIWDFGGQGSMHATHPYFFSRRAVYLLVLNVREDERVNRAEYWLRLIRTHGGESPVIIVANKIDQFHARLDERTLKDKYSNIFEFVRTSCENPSIGIDELRTAIASAVCTFEDIGVRTPESLVKVKQVLEGMTDPKGGHVRDTLSVDEYGAICDQNGVDPDLRAGFLRRLNDQGIMLYFGDDARLDLNVVLNPFWVTEGVYRIINYEPIALAGGQLKVEQVRSILPRERYASDKAMYILDMMRKFELCFPLDEHHTLFLLPDLLPTQQPELPPFDREEALKLQFEYPVWQGAILTRLLVRLYHYLVPNTYWRNGALFQAFDKKNRALVIADEADRRLRLWVDGELSTRRSLLNRIREELNVIHGNQREQSVSELVVTPQGGELSYKLLVALEDKGKETHDLLVGNDLIEVNVKALLNGVRAEVRPASYRLTELIVERFSLNELDDLCFRFKISLEDIEGQPTLGSKARNLVRQFERTRRMPELMAALRDLRKGMTWE